MSELDAANAAPPASDSERKTVLGWTALVIVFGLIALFVAGTYIYKANKAHKAEVAKIESAPVVLPPVVKPPIYKRIIKPKEAEAKITPPKADFWSFGKTEKPAVKDEFTSEFDKKLAEFERKIP